MALGAVVDGDAFIRDTDDRARVNQIETIVLHFVADFERPVKRNVHRRSVARFVLPLAAFHAAVYADRLVLFYIGVDFADWLGRDDAATMLAWFRD